MEEGARFRFANTFYWGSATSAYQIEGGNNNDWSEWERSSERIHSLRQQGRDPAAFASGKAADFWNLFEKDLDNAHLLGHTMFRMSIEWSRIEPQEGRFDDDAIEHYRRMIRAVRARGMEPMVTLWHFTNPIWFAQKGGFLSGDASNNFTRYAVRVVRALQDDVRYWVTFNEATTVYAWMTYGSGQWLSVDSGIRPFVRFRRGIANIHNRVYREIKSLCSNECQVGSVENNRAIVGPLRFLVQGTLNRRYNHWLWRHTKNDFLGLNYYTTRRFIGSPKNVAKEMNWEVWPEGIYRVIKEAASLKKPIFITENGIADAADSMREDFIREHISWIAQAIHDGIRVKGYLYWSLIDNFEWAEGFRPRFGLVEVDYQNQRRKIRRSAHAYAKIIREHVVDLPRSRSADTNRHRGRR